MIKFSKFHPIITPKNEEEIKITKVLICSLLHSLYINDFLTTIPKSLDVFVFSLRICTRARTHTHTRRVTHISGMRRHTTNE